MNNQGNYVAKGCFVTTRLRFTVQGGAVGSNRTQLCRQKHWFDGLYLPALEFSQPARHVQLPCLRWDKLWGLVVGDLHLCERLVCAQCVSVCLAVLLELMFIQLRL